MYADQWFFGTESCEEKTTKYCQDFDIYFRLICNHLAAIGTLCFYIHYSIYIETSDDNFQSYNEVTTIYTAVSLTHYMNLLLNPLLYAWQYESVRNSIKIMLLRQKITVT